MIVWLCPDHFRESIGVMHMFRRVITHCRRCPEGSPVQRCYAMRLAATNPDRLL